MTDENGWSVNAGRWVGIPVRVHALLFLFVALIFVFDGQNEMVGTGIVTTLAIMVSIILHELAHIFALSNLGGHVNGIMLTPWGGNSDFELPETSRFRALVFMTGPFFNGMLFALTATLLVQTNHVHF